MTVRGGAGPRDDDDRARSRPPMARPIPGPSREAGVPPAPPPSRQRGGTPRRPGVRAGTVSAADVARQRRSAGTGGALRFLVFLIVAAAIVLVALGTVLRPVVRGFVVGLADSNPGALGIPLVAEFVREDLGDDLTAPASEDATEVDFTVSEGETAAGIAARLVEGGLLRDDRAFLLVALDHGVAGQLAAGTFLLRRNLTPDQLVATLLEARDPSITLQFRTGLRLEQLTAYLEARPPEIATLQTDAAAFLALVRKPPRELLADYPWLELPKNATLEGYLAAGAYRILPDSTPEELVRKMLDRFGESLGPERVTAAKNAGSLQAVVTMASLVERETPLDEERALVAGVYQNRLDRGMLLNADPTVIWGVDLLALEELGLADWPEFSFWNVPSDPLASIEFPAAIAGYQTYVNPGMLPGPICTPTVASIDAAIAPSTKKGYLYFVAIPGGGGKHDFSKTYAEHLAKLREYGYIQ